MKVKITFRTPNASCNQLHIHAFGPKSRQGVEVTNFDIPFAGKYTFGRTKLNLNADKRMSELFPEFTPDKALALYDEHKSHVDKSNGSYTVEVDLVCAFETEKQNTIIKEDVVMATTETTVHVNELIASQRETIEAYKMVVALTQAKAEGVQVSERREVEVPIIDPRVNALESRVEELSQALAKAQESFKTQIDSLTESLAESERRNAVLEAELNALRCVEPIVVDDNIDEDIEESVECIEETIVTKETYLVYADQNRELSQAELVKGLLNIAGEHPNSQVIASVVRAMENTNSDHDVASNLIDSTFYTREKDSVMHILYVVEAFRTIHKEEEIFSF